MDKIKELKESISIPVIANGDIFKAGQAKMLLDQGYCDGVMLGRSVKNNPSFFLEIKELLEEKHPVERTRVSTKEVFEIFYNHYLKQRKTSLHQLQDHASWFVSGEAKASEYKARIRSCQSFEEVKDFFDKNIN
jgi:tRNA-dihydrouridine synthase B